MVRIHPSCSKQERRERQDVTGNGRLKGLKQTAAPITKGAASRVCTTAKSPELITRNSPIGNVGKGFLRNPWRSYEG
jgi:hypothetical protein